MEQIRENPYLQYFLGMHENQFTAPSNPSMLVHFRKRLDLKTLTEINGKIIQLFLKQSDEKRDSKSGRNDSDDHEKPRTKAN